MNSREGEFLLALKAGGASSSSSGSFSSSSATSGRLQSRPIFFSPFCDLFSSWSLLSDKPFRIEGSTSVVDDFSCSGISVIVPRFGCIFQPLLAAWAHKTGKKPRPKEAGLQARWSTSFLLRRLLRRFHCVGLSGADSLPPEGVPFNA